MKKEMKRKNGKTRKEKKKRKKKVLLGIVGNVDIEEGAKVF